MRTDAERVAEEQAIDDTYGSVCRGFTIESLTAQRLMTHHDLKHLAESIAAQAIRSYRHRLEKMGDDHG